MIGRELFGRRMRSALLMMGAVGCGAATPHPEEGERETTEPHVVALRLDEASQSPSQSEPRTELTLVLIRPDGHRESRALTVEPGACYHESMPGALIAARCWWGEAASRFVVRRRGNNLVVERSAEQEGALSDPREVGRIEVSSDVELRVLRPRALEGARR